MSDSACSAESALPDDDAFAAALTEGVFDTSTPKKEGAEEARVRLPGQVQGEKAGTVPATGTGGAG
eukprot:8982278-Pyramimonas_sp.AAC.1